MADAAPIFLLISTIAGRRTEPDQRLAPIVAGSVTRL
jgi:hypothetical protein